MFFSINNLGRADNFVLLLALLELVVPSTAVKFHDFKTCQQSGFCRRNRDLADKVTAAGTAWSSPYELNTSTISFSKGKLSATILKNVVGRNEPVELPLTISVLENGVTRVTIDESRRKKGDIELRNGSKARKERYDEAEKHVIVGGLTPQEDTQITTDDKKKTTTITFGPGNTYEVFVSHNPFNIQFKRDKETHIILNERNFFNVEHWRAKPEDPKPVEPSSEGSQTEEPKPEVKSEENADGGWDESFGGNTDSKPRGPESLSMDITFPGYEHVYGIPEHASRLSLKQTRGGEGNYDQPYRLYNTDVFEYITDSPMTLYGAIPFMQAHKKGSTVGVFWLNPAETWIDIIKHTESGWTGSTQSTKTHWMLEAGLVDIFVFLGPTTEKVMKAYGALTGYTELPQSFAIMYHQCRWNYVSQDDVKDVDKKFDKADIPYDVIWLDIEYTDAKKYFTFDPLNFPDPQNMGKNLQKRDRKLVVIIDPHIKNTDNYPVVTQLKDKNYGVLNKDSNLFEGWCWPGSSHWIDCFNPAAVEWWKTLFTLKNFAGTMKNTFIWNDMNEPSVFNGPETTMPKDNIHYGSWEHRDIHNLNGHTYMDATHQALETRFGKGKDLRSFILTRSFYAGSQRLGAMWTGDNVAHWDHLAASMPMVMSNGIAGMPFAGADVGGFFGNPTKELLTRWYQVGIFYPFFRGHAHIDAKRREPYIPGDPWTSIIRSALRVRYQLLPAWYTAFHRASTNGMPIIVPHYIMFPDDESGFAIEDQFFLGDTGILAKPVVTEGATSVDVYFADDEIYYDYFTYKTYLGKGTKNIDAPLEKIPMFMRGGNIIPRKDRHRRSSGLMKYDPYTFVVALDTNGNAQGTLYVDDGETFDFRKGQYIHRAFTFDSKNMTLSSISLHPNPSAASAYVKTMKDVRIEKIIIVGANYALKSKSGDTSETGRKVDLKVTEGKETRQSVGKHFAAVDGNADYLVVKDPKVGVGRDWAISFV